MMMDFMRSFMNFYEMAEVCSNAYNSMMHHQRQQLGNGMQGGQEGRDRQFRNDQDRLGRNRDRVGDRDRYRSRSDQNQAASRSDHRTGNPNSGRQATGSEKRSDGHSNWPNSSTPTN